MAPTRRTWRLKQLFGLAVATLLFIVGMQTYAAYLMEVPNGAAIVMTQDEFKSFMTEMSEWRASNAKLKEENDRLKQELLRKMKETCT